jgi:hypothetical protein
VAHPALDPASGDELEEVGMARDESAERQGAEGVEAGQSEGAGERASEAPVGGALTAEQLERLRQTLVEANPEAVPELIAGGDFEALLASVGPAREAYRRVRETAARAALGGVPRGGGVREPDPALYADLAPEAKIAAGLERGSRAVG